MELYESAKQEKKTIQKNKSSSLPHPVNGKSLRHNRDFFFFFWSPFLLFLRKTHSQKNKQTQFTSPLFAQQHKQIHR